MGVSGAGCPCILWSNNSFACSARFVVSGLYLSGFLLRVEFESSSSKLDTKIVQSLPWNCVLSLYLIERESVE